jgi:cytochrome c553
MNASLNILLALLVCCFVGSVAMAQEDGAFRPDVAEHMHEHLNRISAIKAAVVAGELEAAREPAAWLAEHEAAQGLPPGWEAFVSQMREYARNVLVSSGLEGAAANLTGMAQTCGRCHRANNSEVTFGFDQKPRHEIDGRRTHMQRHLWGIDRMWDGLIGPSDKAWNAGSDFLFDVPLTSSEISRSGEPDDNLTVMANRVHVLGANGMQAQSAQARGEIFSELLALCGNCHKKLQTGPAH